MPDTTPALEALAHDLRAAMQGEVRADGVTRHQYASDASIYRIDPLAVVFPRDADDIVAAVTVARGHGVPVLARGAGTSLAGQTVAAAVVLDCSRHLHAITTVDAEQRMAHVQPGVVQDDLNRAAARHGLMFAPDTSTANRATLGGMIGNNSCGMRSARYGMTIDHVEALDVVLADGSRAHLAPCSGDEVAARGRIDSLEGRLYREVPALVSRTDAAIRRDIPPFWRRSGGYRLERLLPDRGPFSLANLVVGSEGTLAVVAGAQVRLVPIPRHVVALAGHFASVREAIAATDDAQACGASAIELVDHFILDLSRRSPLHREFVSFLEGEPGALLFVEFHADDAGEAQAAADTLEARWRRGKHGYAVLRASRATELRRFRELRNSGQGLLLAAGVGGERSIAFIEDTAVEPSRLADYVDRLERILAAHGLRAGFYGHASAGCLHVRPFMDLRRPRDVEVMRAVAEEVLAVVTEFGGNNSSEHGDGLVRSAFNARIFGSEVYGAMQAVKGLFDPEGRLNPGKKVDAPPMTASLREPGRFPQRALGTHFDFGSAGMFGAAERCARIGQCRKSPGAGATMCPSFMATRDERHSTRGRAVALADALLAPDPRAALGDARLHEALDLCLECKACQVECPLGVDMAALKSEFLAQYQAQHGTSLRTRLFGHARTINQVGSALAPVANALSRLPFARAAMHRWLGIDRRRQLPTFARESLGAWHRGRAPIAHGASRGPVVFLADSFTSFTEPDVGRAAIELLEMAGHEVTVVDDVCCGRSFISKGMLDEARRRQRDLVARLGPQAERGIPIVGVEPSCVFTLTDELQRLGAGGVAPAIAAQARLVDALLVDAIASGALVARGTPSATRVLLHTHCHQKAAGAANASAELLHHLPNCTVEVLDAGCCGMAGSFGYEAEHHDVSMAIGEQRLFPAVRSAPDAVVVATGTSCRQQVLAGTSRTAVHPVVLAHAHLRRP